MSWNIIQRIREGQKVPTADASTNVYVNDVVGNKTDAAVTTATTTKSVMAYVKGCLARFVPSLTAATTAGTIVQDSTTGTPDVVVVTSSASANTFGSWTELDAAVSADSWLMGFTISCYNNLAGDSEIRWCVEIGTGASPAAKVRVSGQQCNTYIAAGGTSNFTIMPMFVSLPIPIKVASGTAVSARVAIREADAGGVTFHIGLSVYQGLET